MRAKHTGYSVPGWGAGDLWTSDGAVLAHEFAFREVTPGNEGHAWRGQRDPYASTDALDGTAAPLPAGGALDGVGCRERLDDPGSGGGFDSAVPGAAPRQGATGPPTGTLPARSPRMDHGSVPESGRSVALTRAGHPMRERMTRTLDPDELVERFVAFLRGGSVEFGDVELDLGGFTPFQVAVAHTLRAIPRGEVVSYAEVAALAGHPGAQRAVGTFCARNRFAILLPCHRVVGANGIGGYGEAGVGVKRRLLRLEGVVL